MFFLAAEAFSSLSVFKKSGIVFLYLTLGLIVLVGVIGVLVRVYKTEKLTEYLKNALSVGIGYSFAVAGIMLFLKFDELVTKGSFSPQVFWPIFALFVLTVLLAFGGLVLSFLKKKYLNVYTVSSIAVVGLYVLVYIAISLAKQYKERFVLADEVGLIVSILVLAGVVAVLLFFFDKKSNEENKTKSIVYAAICIAMSFALSYIRFFRMPQGGSITLVSTLPLMLYSYMFGIRKGVFACFIYGLMQAMQDPYILHPIQFLLDYPFAFAMIGFAGLFKHLPILKDKLQIQFVAGGLVFAILRYASHVITGTIVFKAYAPAHLSAISYSLVYNTYVFIDAIIAIVIGSIMLTSKSFVKQLEISAN